MKGIEFFNKLKKLGKRDGINVELFRERGKGSHSTILYGDRRTRIPNLKNELKSGTLAALLRQLGLKLSDL
jgi:mRNA interferase HicA